MKANVLRKAMTLLLVTAMAIASFSGIKAEAEEIKLPIPKISVKTVNDGTGVEVTINKTKDADGFEVWVSGYADQYLGYKNISDEYYNAVTLEQNGKQKRTVVLKTLYNGSYIIKVRSYNLKKYGTTRWSDYSKEQSVTITAIEGGYKDKYDFSKAKKGDVIKFGAYEQNNDFTDGKEAIEWIVLKKTKKSIFAVSKYALDCLPYNLELESITWEQCTLRKWLNNEFYKLAFNKSEQAMIKTTKVKNFDNAVYNTPGGNSTKDKVFLLSQLEMIESDYGFDGSYDTYDINRRCAPSEYAVAQGAYQYQGTIEDGFTADKKGACGWWLRSPGDCSYGAAYVGFSGYVGSSGSYVVGDFGDAVRPALWINLKS